MARLWRGASASTNDRLQIDPRCNKTLQKCRRSNIIPSRQCTIVRSVFTTDCIKQETATTPSS